MASATYEVRPVGDDWEIRMAGDSVHELAGSREAAIARARQLVDAFGGGRVIVRRETGEVDREYVQGAEAR